MISFLGHACASADLIVSAIQSWASNAGMRMDTRGFIKSIVVLPVTSPFSFEWVPIYSCCQARQPFDLPKPTFPGDDCPADPQPELSEASEESRRTYSTGFSAFSMKA